MADPVRARFTSPTQPATPNGHVTWSSAWYAAWLRPTSETRWLVLRRWPSECRHPWVSPAHRYAPISRGWRSVGWPECWSGPWLHCGDGPP